MRYPKSVAAFMLPLVTFAAACEPAGANGGDGAAAPSASTAMSDALPATTTTSTPVAAAASGSNALCNEPCLGIERCDPAQQRCVAACPEGEVYVPATGPKGFRMGAALSRKTFDPPHTVVLTKPFCMDATEVTVAAYKRCVDDKLCSAPRVWGLWRNYPNLVDHPVNKVHWKQAKSYCEHRGKSLPSEAQWEWAATGGDGRAWPWGNETPTCKHTDFTQGHPEGPSSDDGCHGGGTSPVGSHPDGDRVLPDGHIHDLAGNVWEWVLDDYEAYPGGDETDPVHNRLPDGVHAIRGGAWNRSHSGIRAQYRAGAVVDYQVPGLGFRCVRNPS